MFDKSIFEVKDNIDDGLDYKKYITSPEDINKSINDFHSGSIKTGYGTGIGILDDYLVAKENEFIAVVGKKGDGKTTILQVFFLMWSIANDLIWVVAFKENMDWAVKISLLNLILGDNEKLVKKQNPLLHSLASEWIDKHFIFANIDSMKQGTELCKGLISDGVKVHALVLDPANSFYSGWHDTGNEFGDGKKTALELLNFTKEVCSVHISQHPTMSGQRQEAPVTSNQAEGGWFFNKASFTYNLNRERGTNLTMMGVENVRNKFTGGGETHPDNPVKIHWSKYSIDIECGNDKVYDVINVLKNKYNPLGQEFNKNEIQGSKDMYLADPKDAFGDIELTKDVPF